MPNALLLKKWQDEDRPKRQSGYVFDQVNKVETKLYAMIRAVKEAKGGDMFSLNLIKANARAIYEALKGCTE